MKVLKITTQEWKDVFKNEYISSFFEPNYLEIVKSSFTYNLHYYAAVKGDKLLFAAAIFEKSGHVVVPDAFIYNSIFFDGSIGDITYVALMNEFIALLQSSFRSISLRLPPLFTDLRPFIWKGFDVQNRYTYLRKSSALLSSKMEKKIKPFENVLSFSAEKLNSESLSYCLDECFKYGLDKREYQNYKKLFISLAKNEYLKVFCVRSGAKILAAQFAVIDVRDSKLFTILIQTFEINDIIPYLNKHLFHWCEANDITSVDMVGANEIGVANFKCSFNAKLTPYYLVSYDERKVRLKNLKEGFKAVVKKMVRK